MINGPRIQLPPFESWEEFERLCHAIWKEAWGDPSAQRNGRQGQPQRGVDVFGHRDGAKEYEGVQAKKKDRLTEAKLTLTEVREEADKAKQFKPEIKRFIMAATSPRDASLQEQVRLLNSKDGLYPFEIEVVSWDDIQDLLYKYDDVLRQFYPSLFPDPSMTQSAETIRDAVAQLSESADRVEVASRAIGETTRPKDAALAGYSSGAKEEALNNEYESELDSIRDLLNAQKPTAALEQLQALEQRAWRQSASSSVKFRILNNSAAANDMLGKHEEAAKLYIKAFEFGEGQEKAVVNSAIGYHYLGNDAEAVKILDEEIAKHPLNSRAVSLKLQIQPDSLTLEEAIKLIPVGLESDQEISFAIGRIAEWNGDHKAAIEWLEKALAADSSSYEVKMSLVQSLVNSVIEHNPLAQRGRLSVEERGKLERAVSVLTELWDSIEDEGIRKARFELLVNRSNIRLILGDKQNSTTDIELALKISERSPQIIRYAAMVAYDQKDYQALEDLLAPVIENPEFPDAKQMLAESRLANKKPAEARALLEVPGQGYESYDDVTLTLLFDIYIALGEKEAVSKLVSETREADPDGFYPLILAAELEKLNGSKANAASLLIKAAERVSTVQDSLLVADKMYALELYKEAIAVFEKVVKADVDSPSARKLLRAYYETDDMQAALKLSKSLRAIAGPDKMLMQVECEIYEYLGDLDSAIEVYLEYLKKNDDPDIRAQLGVAYLRTHKFEELDSYLNSEPDLSTLSYQSIINLARLQLERDRADAAIKTAYYGRRKFTSEPAMQLAYVGLMIDVEKTSKLLADIDSVAPDTVAIVKKPDGTTKTYILESGTADAEKDEYAEESYQYKQLVGKKLHESVVLEPHSRPRLEGEVIEILDKYSYAARNTMAEFPQRFPEEDGLIKVAVPVRPEGEPPEEDDFRPMFDELDKSHQAGVEVEKLYQTGGLPISAFAKLLGKDETEILAAMTRSPQNGIRGFMGNFTQDVDALGEEGAKLIVDITALYVLYSLGRCDEVVSTFGELGVTQSTKDMLSDAIFKTRGARNRGYSVMAKVPGGYTSIEISAVEVERERNRLQGLSDWIDKNCIIVPIDVKVADKKRHESLAGIIGKPAADTLFAATGTGYVLLSDDSALKAVAKNDFALASTSSQVVLHRLLGLKKLIIEQYADAVLWLIENNYKFPSVNIDVFISVSESSSWSPSAPKFVSLLKYLAIKEIETASIAAILARYIFEVWRRPLLPQTQSFLLQALLAALLPNPNRASIIATVKKHLKVLFRLLPIQAKEVEGIIDAWETLNP